MLAFRRLAWVLGVLAVLAVVTTSAAALVIRRPAPLLLRLHGAGVSASVTGAGWRMVPADHQIGYRSGPRVRAPAVYREDWCARADHSSRAFAGFVATGGRSVREIARRWAAAISRDPRTGRLVAPVDLVVGDHRRADADLDVPTGPCNPPRDHLTVVVAGEEALVLVRDVGVEDALPATAAEAIVRSLRWR